jgi:DNA-directed RNA polymerase specialized sigma24 family protein
MRGALDWLSLQHPRRYRLVRTVLVDHEPRALDEHAHVDLDLGVLMIALRVRTVRVPPWLMERTAADERRDAIVELAAIGLTAGEIARRTGIPRGTVRKRLRW